MAITESRIDELTRRDGERLALADDVAYDPTDAELAELNDRFERQPATKIIAWAVEHFAPHLAMTASMTDAVLIDLATRVDPAIEVVFIDTATTSPRPWRPATRWRSATT